jgi:serine-type D-Ala-D-Ala carboxypeptidase (penicillin-binding protein 5/6)
MSQRILLEGGELRRGNSRRLRGLPPLRPKRRRRTWLLVAALVVLALVVVLVTAGGDDGRSVRHRARSAVSTPRNVKRAPRPRPAKPVYGGTPAPAAELVRAPFRKFPRGGLLFDLRSGRVLWSYRPQRVLPIASVTKIMTALLVDERAQPTDRVLITRTALAYQGSGVGLLPRGRRVPLQPVLYGMLLPSGNDAALALAQHVAGGSVPRFVNQMNDRAGTLGLRCSHFVGPDGYDDANRSCARDLAVLAHAFLSRPRLAAITRVPYAALPFPIKGGKLFLASHNPLMQLRYRGVTGIKTGFSDAAGLCFVGTARRGRTQLGVVLLNSPQPGAQASRLLDRGFAALRGRATATTPGTPVPR